MGDSLERVRSFSKLVRQQLGYELESVQLGMEPSDWKPMPTVGPGDREDIEGRHRNGKNSVSDRASNRGIQEMMQRATKAKNGTDVFSDLGFNAAEAENLRIRSAMMRALVAFIRKNELTQARAAKVFGISQPRISDLIRGKIHLFSIDNLVILLAAAGLRVDLKIKKAA
jgi:predicted XRE-type DNA-binding protein